MPGSWWSALDLEDGLSGSWTWSGRMKKHVRSFNKAWAHIWMYNLIQYYRTAGHVQNRRVRRAIFRDIRHSKLEIKYCVVSEGVVPVVWHSSSALQLSTMSGFLLHSLYHFSSIKKNSLPFKAFYDAIQALQYSHLWHHYFTYIISTNSDTVDSEFYIYFGQSSWNFSKFWTIPHSELITCEWDPHIGKTIMQKPCTCEESKMRPELSPACTVTVMHEPTCPPEKYNEPRKWQPNLLPITPEFSKLKGENSMIDQKDCIIPQSHLSGGKKYKNIKI